YISALSHYLAHRDFHSFPTRRSSDLALLVRWTFDLDSNSDSYTEELLTDLGGEFPRLDERFAGHGYRHGYYAAMKRPNEAPGSSDRKSTRLNSSHVKISYAVFCLKKK